MLMRLAATSGIQQGSSRSCGNECCCVDEESNHDIKWNGLWDKNSDKLYAPDQLLPEEEYKSKHKTKYDAQMQRFGDLYEQAKKVMKLNN